MYIKLFYYIIYFKLFIIRKNLYIYIYIYNKKKLVVLKYKVF